MIDEKALELAWLEVNASSDINPDELRLAIETYESVKQSNKHTETDILGNTPELTREHEKRVQEIINRDYATQKSDYEKTDEQGRPLTYWGGLKDESTKT